MSHLIGELQKHAAEKIVVQIVDRNGKFKIDARQYFRPDEGSDWLPTKKGITFDVTAWPLFRAIIEQLDGEMEKLGIRNV